MASSITYPSRRALVIGINEYADEATSLQMCVDDAKGLGNALRSIESDVSDKFNVSDAFNCKYDEFTQIVDLFVKTIEKEDFVLFYFAGHAEEFNDKNYLLPAHYNYDHSINETEFREKNSMNAQNILHRITSARPLVTIFILDCCRTKRTRLLHMTGLSPMNVPPETLVVFSCGPGKRALDESFNGINGIFAENLLKHIKTSDEDIETVFMNVARDVKIQTNGFQMPYRTSCLVA